MPIDSAPIVRAAIYARVSSEEQREGQTIDSQIAELERFSRAQGWATVEIYKDEGWSGAVLARPALDRLRDDASKKSFELVLLNDVDRLARDVSHLGVIKRDLERHGVQVRFRKLPAEQSPTANLMVNILGSFAEFEREMITDRTRRGRRHKVEVRQQFLGSLSPYGYRYVTKSQAAAMDGYLELVAEQAAVVRQMFQWVDHEGLSARRVMQRLNDLGVRPAKGGRLWGKSSVLRVLHCETYAGVWHYNKSESYAPSVHREGEYRRLLKYKLRPRPREEWIRVRLPDALHIIERGQWERVQAQLARNQSFSKRNSKHVYLLRGLVRCGGCGARYVGDPNHGRFYYRCLQRCKKYPAVREGQLSEIVWDSLVEAILNPKILIDQIKRRELERESKTAQDERDAREVEKGLRQIAEEERRILEAYRLGAINPAQLGRELEGLGARRNALNVRQAKLTAQSLRPKLPTIRHQVIDYCREAGKWIRDLAKTERQRLLQFLIEEIIFKGDEVTIRGIIPGKKPEAQEATVVKGQPDQTNDSPVQQPVLQALQIRSPGVTQDRQIDRIEGREFRHGGRNSVGQFSHDRVADMEMQHGGHNPVNVFASDRIADMERYPDGRNQINHFTFEFTKCGLQREPTWSPERLKLLGRHIARNPKVPLRELCDWMHRQHGIRVSITEMSRARIRVGFRMNRHQPRAKLRV